MPDLLRQNLLFGAESDAAPAGLAATVSTLSHELRTPLASMKSSLGLVVSGETGPVNADQSHFLGMTMRNIDRLERLISDLLDVSRCGARGTRRPHEETDLAPVLREALQMQATAADRAGLDFDFTRLPESLPAHLDPDKVMQILANIVGNAIKYTPRGGRVRVWAEARPLPGPDTAADLARRLGEFLGRPLATIGLVVEDSGPGLNPDEQIRVFEPGYRARRSRADKTPGSGLGLSITRSLVEAHGGRIRLSSEPGHGTCVWIRLPGNLFSENLLRAARQAQALLAQGSPRRLLVLDASGARIGTTFSVAGAVAEFQRGRPDLVAHGVVSVTDQVLVAVVGAVSGWQTAWQKFRTTTGQVALPGWQILNQVREQVNKESINGSARR